ncbi:MAG: LPS biosynthesis protein WbpP, partial [Nitrospinota bacterium]
GVSGEVFNVGSGERHSVKGLLEKLSEIIGVQVEPRYGPPRPGDMRDTLADISRARARLGYQPVASFEEGLEGTVRWFQGQAAGE